MTERWSIHHGDVLDRLPELEPESFDAVLCDPPYGIRFMGRAWDHGVPGEPVWSLVREALKPGAHLLAFGGTRTEHRLVCAIEDAGFEIRDKVIYCFGSGFPKSMAIDKAIDKRREEDAEHVLRVTRFIHSAVKRKGMRHAELLDAFGFNSGSGQIGHWVATTTGAQPAVPKWDQWLELKALLGFGDEMDAEVWRLNGRKGQPGAAWAEREVVGRTTAGIANPNDKNRHTVGGSRAVEVDITTPATDLAKRFHGYGTALKPAYEPCVVAMKPLDGTFAANAAAHGVAGLWIDGCRIVTGQRPTMSAWDKQPSLCDSCAVSAARDAAQEARETSGCSARVNANPLVNGRGGNILPGINKPDTGCSDGMKVESMSTSSSIGGCGKMQTAPSRMGAKSTTPTATRKTTGSATCASCGSPIIGRCTSQSTVATKNGKLSTQDAHASAAPQGRWPSNLILDAEAAAMLDAQSGTLKSGRLGVGHGAGNNFGVGNHDKKPRKIDREYGNDTGGASRFFYTAKASTRERNAGLEDGVNRHPTLKPIDLCRYLATLILPPRRDTPRRLLVPFSGSGSEMIGALLAGWDEVVGIEREREYIDIAERRLAHWCASSEEDATTLFAESA